MAIRQLVATCLMLTLSPTTHARQAKQSAPTAPVESQRFDLLGGSSNPLNVIGHHAAAHSSPIFVFHANEFWLNLHQFMYVLGRAENKTRDSSRSAVAGAPSDQEQGLSKLTDQERKIWHEAVGAYATNLSKKDAVFDDPLPSVANALTNAGDARSLKDMPADRSISEVLERAAPIYRKAWWQKHRQANRAWQSAMEALVKRYGSSVLTFITNAYKMEWPSTGYGVHISGYANWAGAYSTRGNLLIVSSLDQGIQGTLGLETIFHEGMHQWDELVLAALREQARRANKRVPANLSHALIFFTAGEAVRNLIPAHVPYADKFGLWERLGPPRIAFEEVWKPYLKGHGTRDEAFLELIKRTGS